MYTEFTSGVAGDALYQELYRGAIIRFRDLKAMRDLVGFTRDFLQRFLAPHAPIESHRHYAPKELAEIYAFAQREFARSRDVQSLWRDTFIAAGLDARLTARDRIILRFQPPELVDLERPWARSTATVNFHRDTWGTNLYSQINWWAPVYPIDAGRTFAFFPDLFGKPLANTSADFDISDVMRRNREAPETVKAGEMIPKLLEPVDLACGQPVLIEPSEVIAFSAQHAHVGVRNRSDFTRISMDTRTLNILDQIAGRGAANVDGRARWMTPGMFKRVSDGKPLSELLGIEDLVQFEASAQSSAESCSTNGCRDYLL